jgi:hypothetical protein
MRTTLPTGIAGLVLLLVTGCTIPSGRIKPHHFRFVTVHVPEPGQSSGGWRAACVHARMNNLDTGQTFLCKFGVGVPLRTAKQGEISTSLAQRIAADCANHAAYAVLMAADEQTMLGIACQNFRNTYDVALKAAIVGSRVNQTCAPGTTPVVFGAP